MMGESKLIPVSQLLIKHIEDAVKQLHVILIDYRKVLLDIHVRYIVAPHMIQRLVDIRLRKLHHIPRQRGESVTSLVELQVIYTDSLAHNLQSDVYVSIERLCRIVAAAE